LYTSPQISNIDHIFCKEEIRACATQLEYIDMTAYSELMYNCLFEASFDTYILYMSQHMIEYNNSRKYPNQLTGCFNKDEADMYHSNSQYMDKRRTAFCFKTHA
jgi:hypothetical protein